VPFPGFDSIVSVDLQFVDEALQVGLQNGPIGSCRFLAKSGFSAAAQVGGSG
jgi:hypothetical protein